MELDPDELAAAARRWAAVAADLADAAQVLRGAPTWRFGDASGEAVALLQAVERAVAGIGADADRLADGLLVTMRAVVDADEAVAASLAPLAPGDP